MTIFEIKGMDPLEYNWHEQELDTKDSEETPTNPCDYMNCFNGAICLPEEGTCSCDAICDQGIFLMPFNFK